MKFDAIRTLSGETLLAIGGAYLLFTVGTGLILAKNAPRVQACEVTRSHFDCGQYYFNHDDDPAGPYDLAKARYHYEQAILDDPRGNKLTWYQLGRIDFLEGKFDAAIEKFKLQKQLHGIAVHEVDYMLGLTYGYRARRHEQLADWPLAEHHFKEFIQRSPQAPWSRVDLAWIYFSQGKITDMLPVLEQGLIYEPDNPWLLNMYGLAVMNTASNKQVALKYFDQAKRAAASLTTADWGKTYPGNSPHEWHLGLSEFRATIQKNIDLLTG